MKFIISIFLLLVYINCHTQDAAQQGKAFEQAVEAFMSNDIDAAEIQFKNLSSDYKFNEEYKNYINTELFLARIQMARKRNDEATFKLDQLIESYASLKLEDPIILCDLHYHKALNFYEQGRQKKAQASIQAFIEKTQLDARCMNKLQFLLSRIQIELGNYRTAIFIAKETLKYYHSIERDPEKVASLLNILGASYFHADQLDSCQYYWQQALSLKQEINIPARELVIAHFNMGIIHEAKSDYENAITFYKKAEKIDIEDGGEDLGLLPHIYVAFTNSYTELGELNKAKEYAEKSLSLAIKIYGKEDPNTSFSYSAYANQLSKLGNYEASNNYLLKSLEIRKKAYGDYHTWTWEALNHLGRNYLKIGALSKSFQYIQEALKIALKLTDSPELLATSQYHLSSYYSKKKSFDLSKKANEKSSKLFESIFAKDHLWNVKTKLQKANLLNDSGDPEQAQQIIKEIYALNLRDQNSSKLLRLLETYGLEKMLLYEAYRKDPKAEQVDKIISITKTQNQLIHEIRWTYDNSDSKIYYNNTVNSYFEKSLEIFYEIKSDVAFTKLEALLLELFEVNRSSVLLGHLQNQKLESNNSISEKDLIRERYLNKQIDLLKESIQKEQNKTQANKVEINKLLSKQLAFRKERDHIITALRNQMPLFGTTKLISKEEIISKASKINIDIPTAIVEYFQVDEYIYCLVIQNEEISFKRIAINEDFFDQVANLLRAVSKRGAYKESARRLHEILISPLDIEAQKIIMIPDGILSQIPFDILLDTNDKMLIEKYTLSYANSLNLLFEQIAIRQKDRKASSWVGFAPNIEERPLSASSTELAKIQEITGGSYYATTHANKANYFKKVAHKQVIHLATHSVFMDQDSSNVYLLFNGEEGKEYLSLSDIYHQNLQAELVVLSACETGIGSQQKSEGMLSLARAFHVAGVPTTLMSLWRIPDKETQKIMELFYENLVKGRPIDESLQEAKLSYLNQSDDLILQHPYFWAGFSSVGAIEAINISSGNAFQWMLYLFMILAVGFLLSLLFKRFQRS